MEQFLYERPREKLQSRGSKFLTIAELIQIIIGSGSIRASGAQLARRIAKGITPHASTGGGQLPTYNQLIAMSGVGVAKASQILAAIELGRRVQAGESTVHAGGAGLGATQSFLSLASTVRAGPPGILCVWFDGSGHEIDRKWYTITPREHPTVLVRRLFVDVVAAAAHAITIAHYIKTTHLTPQVAHLELVKAVKDTANVLQVTLNGFLAVNHDTYQDWGREI